METLAAIILVIILGGFPAMVMATMHRRVTYIMKELETHWDHFNYGDKTNSRDLDKFKTEIRERFVELSKSIGVGEIKLERQIRENRNSSDTRTKALKSDINDLEEIIDQFIDILGYKKQRVPPRPFFIVKKKEE